jgi:hypothetical protein
MLKKVLLAGALDPRTKSLFGLYPQLYGVWYGIKCLLFFLFQQAQPVVPPAAGGGANGFFACLNGNLDVPDKASVIMNVDVVDIENELT